MIEEWLNQYAPNAPYLVIFGVLVLAGFGLPMPEDIPLMIGGYLCGQTEGHPHLWIMIPGCMVSIMSADTLIYGAGRRWGQSINQHWLMKRIVGGRNIARARVLFKRHGAKFVFFARFLPGVRTPAFFTAGTFKMPFSRFLLWNGSAMLLSVPWVVLLSAYFSEEIDYARVALAKGKTYGFLALGVAVAVFVGYHLLVSRKLKKVKVERELVRPGPPPEPGD